MSVPSYEQLGTSIGALVERKQAGYGDSFSKCGEFLALLYPNGMRPDQYVDALATVRIFDKLMRVANGGHGDGETPWRDITGYALLSEKRALEKREGGGRMKPLLDALPALPSNGLRVVSLFAGGGLFDLGVIHAGFNVVQAFEFDFAPTIAYAHNIGDHIVGPRTWREKRAGIGDLTKVSLDDIVDCDVIIGGPPCQSWSVAGRGEGEADPRGQLVWRYLEIIEAKRPRAFMFENVKGLTTKKHRKTLDALLAKFDDIGYNVTWRVVNAWDYGVSQRRERVIIVGIRKDLAFTYEWPASEYETSGYRPVLRDAIGDLPEPGAQSDGEFWTPKATYTYGQANRRMSWDRPSNTIPAHHNSGQPQHPDRDGATFTVTEALHVQSAPSWYAFPRGISMGAKFRVTGNGVASRMAYHLAAALASQLIAHSMTEREVNTTDYANAA